MGKNKKKWKTNFFLSKLQSMNIERRPDFNKIATKLHGLKLLHKLR